MTPGTAKLDIDIAVVPVAGLGTRLLPATKSQPKEMLPVGRKPAVQYVVEELNKVGMKRLIFITGPGKTSIENHFDLNEELTQALRETGKEDLLEELEYERGPAAHSFVRQRRLLGLGHAVLCARPFVGEQPFVLALGDSIIGLGAQSTAVRRMIETYFQRGAAAVVAFEEVPKSEIHHYGVASPKSNDEIFELLDVVEKPSRDEAPSNLAVAARYVLAPSIFDALENTKPGKGGEIQLTDAIRTLIKEGAKVYGVRLRPDECRYDIGNFDAYFRAFVDFALADPRYGANLMSYLKEVVHADRS
jgi:UTP--glucose-1-phosphate uridylyltransferase